MDVLEQIKQLSAESKSVIDLRCAGDKWSVHAEFGNTMVTVPGSVKKTPEEAVKAAWERWQNRSVEKPFLRTVRDRAQDRYVP